MSMPLRPWSPFRRKPESKQQKYRILELGRPIPITDQVFFTHVVQYYRNGDWGYDGYAKSFEEAVAYIAERHAQEEAAVNNKILYTE